MNKRIVIALGGNALGNNPKEQQEMIEKATAPLVGLISQGYEIILTHGNGPQVGMSHTAFEIASDHDERISKIALSECTAMSQGYIGYHLQKGILKELRKQNMPWQVASMVTQVVVDENDEGFKKPTKPIGEFYTKDEAENLMKEDGSLSFIEDSGRGYRQVVPSPKPIDIVEKKSILNLLDNEFIVITCGGGGVPVVRDDEGNYKGVNAVIDKDFASAKLAEIVEADYLFILTAVDRVCINFARETQEEISAMSVEQAKKYIKEEQFAKGSMLPKVEAAIQFAQSKAGRVAVISSLEKAPLSIQGRSGTKIFV